MKQGYNDLRAAEAWERKAIIEALAYAAIVLALGIGYLWAVWG